MTPSVRHALLPLALIVLCAASAAGQAAPEPGPPARGGQGRRGALEAPAATPAEIDAMFDTLVLNRAQQVLQLPDEQYIQFFRRMSHLQNLQKMHRNTRRRVLMQLRQLVAPAAAGDDNAIALKIKELDDVERSFAEQERQALIAIDVILQPKQRGQFRVFLENMEQRKVELLVAAQQGRGAPLPPRAGQAPIR